jgi:hypothetical protein
LNSDIRFFDDLPMAVHDEGYGRPDRAGQVRFDIGREFMFVQDMQTATIHENVHGQVAPDE